MTGDLAEGVVPGLLRELYVGRQNGTLFFTRREEEQAIRLQRGHIVNARTNVTRDRLGEILVRHGRLSEEDLERATKVVLEEKKRLGEVLLGMGLIDERGLEDAVALRVHELLTKVFTWNDGHYRFEVEPEEVVGPGELTLKLSTGELILEAVRAIRDPDVVRYLLGDMDRVLAPSSDPILRFQKLGLTSNDGFVLSRIDGTLSAREVEQLIPLPAEEVRRSLLGLISTGVVGYIDDETRPRPKTEAPAAARQPETEEPEKEETGADEESPGAEGVPAPDTTPVGQNPDLTRAEAAETPVPEDEASTDEEKTGADPPAAPSEPEPKADTAPVPTPEPEPTPDTPPESEPENEAVAARRREIEEAWEGLKKKSHFDVLGLTRKASASDVKEAYFRLARRFHPDVHHGASLGDLREKLETVFIRLGEAYEVLRDTDARREYEERLKRFEPRPGSPVAPPPSAGATAREGTAPTEADENAARMEASVARAEQLYAAAQKARDDPSLKQNYFEAIQIVDPIVGKLSGTLQLRARLVLARCLQENPNWVKRAEEALLTAVAEQPQAAEAYLLLGELYADQDLRTRAASMFRKVLGLRPGEAKAAAALARLEGDKDSDDKDKGGGLFRKIFKR
jgi:TolA-binding protein